MTLKSGRLAVALCSLIFPATAAAETILVQPGDDLAVAARNLAPGDDLVFSGVSHDLGNGLDVRLEGTAEAPIIIRGANGAVLTSAGDAALRITGAHVVVQGLMFEGSGAGLSVSGPNFVARDLVFNGTAAGIVCDDCEAIRIKHCEFTGLTDATKAAIQVDVATLTDIDNNWIHDNAGAGIRLGAADQIRITDNVIESTLGVGIEVETPADSNAAIANAIVANFVDGATTGISLTGGGALLSNVVTNTVEDGILSTLSAVGVFEASVVHNTVLGAANCFRASQWSVSLATNIVANNAFYCAATTAIRFDDGFGMESLIIGNVVSGSSDVPEAVAGAGLTDFVDGMNLILVPSATSALVDAGEPAYAVSPDYDGNTRDASPDAGAYEYTRMNSGVAPGGGFKSDTMVDPGMDPDPRDNDPDDDEESEGIAGGSIGGADGFPARDGGCAGCSTAPSPGGAWLSLLLLGLLRLRR